MNFTLEHLYQINLCSLFNAITNYCQNGNLIIRKE